MKRLRSSEDLDSYGDKCKDPNPSLNPNPSSNSNPSRSSSQYRTSFYHKSENVRKGGLVSSSSAVSSRYDRDRSSGGEDDREGSRVLRKRSEHDFDGFDRRKGFDRYSGESRGGGGGGGGYDRSLIHRSESFCGGGSSTSLSLSSSRREFPKRFRSERSSSGSDPSRREGSVSSWRRFGNNGNKDSEERSRIGLRDVKSPTWSRDSAASEQSRMVRVSAASTVTANTVSNSGSSPLRTVSRSDSRAVAATKESSAYSNKSKSKSKSPTWSRESGASEQSKRMDVEMVKKSEETQVESGSSSEMEEGELEPEPEPEQEPEPEPEPELESNLKVEAEAEIESGIENKEDGVKVLSKEEEREVLNKECDSEVKDVEKEDGKVDELSSGSESGDGDEAEAGNDEGCGGDDKEECVKEDGECVEEEGKNDGVVDDEDDDDDEKSLGSEEECDKQDKGVSIDLEAKVEDVEMEVVVEEVQELDKEVGEENGGEGEVNMGGEREEGLSQNFKDKGKSVSIEPTHVADSAEDGVWMEREPREFERDSDDMEGPSTRGFELFSTSPVRREEKNDQSGANRPKEEKLVLEPFDLSLSLPNVLLPIGASQDTVQAAPGSPSQARSVQSMSTTFRTNSDGFTASMSFSGSQSFFHNPSCSLTQNSMDNFEQSVGSRPIFQGIDQASQGAWQGQSQNESKPKDIPLYQRILMNGNGSLNQSQVLQGISNGQAVQGQHHRGLEGSSKMGNGLERQLSFHRQQSFNDDVRSPSQSVGSHDIGSNYSYDKKRRMREKSSGSLYRTSGQKEFEYSGGGAEYVEKIIAKIVEEPVHVMARKFHDMTAQSIVRLKESINDIMLSVDKQKQLVDFQKALQNKSDITLETLQKSPRAQLEILVALRTGLPEYLQLDDSVTNAHLAEVFLNLKCRNLACKSSLPVDECDCKVCVQKKGFCSACMCLVCSKFDMANKTCSWVGCDVCLHWCHTDCALRKSYIINGRSAKGAYGTTEMQFHCIACDHPSELFGFVNEVFQNFVKEWTAETLSRELDYVKRIFRDSKDMRGRRLHEIADQMLVRLANKLDLPEVCSHILAFLREAETPKLGKMPISSGNEQGKESNGIAGTSQDPSWLKSVYSEKAPQLDRAPVVFPRFSYDQIDKRTLETELQTSIQKEPVFDELESLVRIKEAEAKMFQARADEARREAEGLKRIAIAKKEKIEEEYTGRFTKLRLAEAQEMRKQKYEEVQALDRAHREYHDMKRRMQADIKDLLLKMEATRQS
ncbi:protein OBERON 4 [Quercus suber]|uniref:Protein oberon 4 n=1 Tax=Quercus suber TaxID=58331 RepID=A0AAW0JHU7_QUESU